MSDKEWEKFFDLLEKVTTPSAGQSWQERKEEVLSKAIDCAGDGCLEEFNGWFQE